MIKDEEKLLMFYQLEKLISLWKKGMLSDDEFAKQFSSTIEFFSNKSKESD